MSAGGKRKAAVSVIIVNYNGASVLERCLASVFAQPYRPIEVIVMDNGSTDNSTDMVRQRFPDARLVINDENLGFARACNEGVAIAKSDLVLLLNNDTIVEREWLGGMVDEVLSPGVGVVTSRVITDDVPAEFYAMNGTINYLGYNIMREFADLSTVFFAGGASLLFSRTLSGTPFLPEYFLYHEDVYLSWRMRLRGFAVHMVQSSVVRHAGSVSAKRQPSRTVTFYQERNRLLNCLLLYQPWTLCRLLPFLLADAIAKIMLSLLTGRKSTAGIVTAYWWCVCRPGWIKTERRRLQRERSVPDREIMKYMSHRFVDSGSAIAMAINRMSRAYADLVGLAYHG